MEPPRGCRGKADEGCGRGGIAAPSGPGVVGTSGRRRRGPLGERVLARRGGVGGQRGRGGGVAWQGAGAPGGMQGVCGRPAGWVRELGAVARGERDETEGVARGGGSGRRAGGCGRLPVGGLGGAGGGRRRAASTWDSGGGGQPTAGGRGPWGGACAVPRNEEPARVPGTRRGAGREAGDGPGGGAAGGGKPQSLGRWSTHGREGELAAGTRGATGGKEGEARRMREGGSRAVAGDGAGREGAGRREGRSGARPTSGRAPVQTPGWRGRLVAGTGAKALGGG